MTPDKFEKLLGMSANSQEAFDSVVEFADELAAYRVKSSGHFWDHILPLEQKLWALCCVLLQGGSNGMCSIVDQNRGAALATICLAAETLDEIGEHGYAAFMRDYLTYVQSRLQSHALAIPRSFSSETKSAFSDAERQFIDDAISVHLSEELRDRDYKEIVCCWDSTISVNTIAWMRQNREEFRKIFCETIEAIKRAGNSN
jgi:hypothetical protein